jgi:predicted dinucleotide-binding enzyme
VSPAPESLTEHTDGDEGWTYEAPETLVTGATGGLGAAIARACVTRGAQVILTGRRAEALAAAATELGTWVRKPVAQVTRMGTRHVTVMTVAFRKFTSWEGPVNTPTGELVASTSGHTTWSEGVALDCARTGASYALRSRRRVDEWSEGYR